MKKMPERGLIPRVSALSKHWVVKQRKDTKNKKFGHTWKKKTGKEDSTL